MADKLNELMADKDFVTKIFTQDSPVKAQEILKENGVDLDIKEIVDMGNVVLYMSKHDGELPDEVAEQVAGGANWASKLAGLPAVMGSFISLIGSFEDFIEIWNNPQTLGTEVLKKYYTSPLDSARENIAKEKSELNIDYDN